MTIYLAHSSLDKQFVDRVAIQLGRYAVVYDKWSFDAGDPLLESMQRGLDDSDGFVLFASLNSLRSVWVNYEINEAEWRSATDRLRTAVTVILRGELDITDLPPWLTRNMVVNSYESQARCTGSHRRNRAPDKIHSPTRFFMGREAELSEIASKLGANRYLAPTYRSNAWP